MDTLGFMLRRAPALEIKEIRSAALVGWWMCRFMSRDRTKSEIIGLMTQIVPTGGRYLIFYWSCSFTWNFEQIKANWGTLGPKKVPVLSAQAAHTLLKHRLIYYFNAAI